jgi:hypothetical protein
MKRVQTKESVTQIDQVKPEPIPVDAPPPKIAQKATVNSTSLALNCILNPQIQPAKPNPMPLTTVTPHPMKHAVPRRHMHIKPATKANALNDQIDRFAMRLADKMGLSVSDFAHPSQMTLVHCIWVGVSSLFMFSRKM